MTILTIGGSGFLSGTIVRKAIDQGHKVWSLTRGQRVLPRGVRGLQADRHDHEAFRRALHLADQHFDMVVDCIGFKPADARQDLDVLKDLGSHLVFISTDFVFDPEKRVFPIEEDHTGFLRDDSYGANKRRCEEVLLSGAAKGLSWTVLRPCHIYGPGSRLGCLPCHGRDAELPQRLRAGESLRLVGAGHFLQQPIFAEDLAEVVLACVGNPRVCGRIFSTAGPGIVESSMYYRIVAEALGCRCMIEEVPIQGYLAEHPEHRSFLCHRIYSLAALAEVGLPVPSTPLDVGLRRQVSSLSG